MEFLYKIFERNKTLAYFGVLNFVLALVLILLSFTNSIEVSGINSMFKPSKFALSIGIYSWTMAFLLYYLENQKTVWFYNISAVICMSFEQIAITVQAFLGQKSHFNIENTFGIILYALMGIFILFLTLHTAVISWKFIKQKKQTIAPTVALAIKIGLVFFIIFSLFGGYISSQTGHTVGANDEAVGWYYLSWSKAFGDLRVAHFFGIHSLQLIPALGYLFYKKLDSAKAKKAIWITSIVYFCWIMFTLITALNGKPLI